MIDSLENIRQAINNNQGVVAIILFLLGILLVSGYKITYKKIFKQKGGTGSKNYQSDNMTINSNNNDNE